MKTLLKALYESEINILIDWMWDSGIQVKIGDRMNGFVAVEIFDIDDFDKIENWIEVNVKKHFPNSKFSKKYKADDFKSAVEPAIRYLFKNHNPHTKIFINYDSAELLQGEQCCDLNDEIPD